MVNAETVAILKLFIILTTSNLPYNFAVLNTLDPYGAPTKYFLFVFILN